MKRLYQAVLVVLCSLSMVACTSMQLVADQSATQSDLQRLAKEQLKPLDFVTLAMSDGASSQLVVSEVREDGIFGTVDGESSEQLFSFDKIRSITLHKKSASKTTGLVVLSTVGAVILFVAFVLATGFMGSGSK